MLLGLSLLLGSVAAKAEDWQLVDVNGRQYISLENVAQFYQLQESSDASLQRVVLADNRPRLETLTNPKELMVNGVKEWLSFPLVYQDGKPLLSRFDLSKTIEPSLRPTMIGNLEPFSTVVLDAGHGGQDGGGSTTTGSEKDYTIDVIRDLKHSLEAKGLKVVLTRSDDTYLGLEQRADLANAIPDAIFVSVHFNSSGDPGATGLEVYAMTPCGAASTGDQNIALDQLKPTPGNDFDNASLALGNCIQYSVLGQMNVGNRGVRRARFAVLRLTHAPAILIEGGFMTNGADSKLITNPAWRQNLAEAVAMGVRNYQNVVLYKQPPLLVADYRAQQHPVSTAATTMTAFRPAIPGAQLLQVGNPASVRRQPLLRPASRSKQ